MPPLKEYIFKNTFSTNVTISIFSYGDEKKAKQQLDLYVKNINDWFL